MVVVYNPYEKYGIRRVINAAGTYTRIGGSISPPEVFKAMEDASKSFVHIPELQQWAGKVIAEATGAEAGLPTAGASNAITLAAAACIMRGTKLENYDPLDEETWTHLIQKLPMHTEGLRTEFIVQRSNRNIYDYAVECAGGNIIEVGTEEGTEERDLVKAYDPKKTAAYYLTDRAFRKRLSLAKVVEIAHRLDTPVIVDAASELPPKKNLRRYVSKGADLVVISGGKFIAGPNNSGLLAGNRNLIKLAHLQAYPFHGIGRGSKMSRETIVGLVTALKYYLKLDEKPLFKKWENLAGWMAEQLNMISYIKAGVTYQTTVEENEPMWPLCYLEIDNVALGLTINDLSNVLRNGYPSIEVGVKGEMLMINPEFIQTCDESIIIERIKKILNSI